LQIISIPVLHDNYIHVLRDDESDTTIVVDPATASPVLTLCAKSQWNLTHILLTHHHGDHTGGVRDLLHHYPTCKVYGFEGDEARLPPLTHKVSDGDEVLIADRKFNIWHLPGHTTGHIGYIYEDAKLAFTGDVLFGMGCGRLFEGTPAEMYSSLQKIKLLPKETLIYCTHEYTVTNGHFAHSILPESALITERLNTAMTMRKAGQFTVPLTLSEELQTNPFLLAKDEKIFRNIRVKRDYFIYQPNKALNAQN
jgi:hydroxyacylglutathione hydrolase